MALSPKATSDIVMGCGGLLLAAGVALIFPPAGVIVAGLLVFAYGLLAIRVDA